MFVGHQARPDDTVGKVGFVEPTSLLGHIRNIEAGHLGSVVRSHQDKPRARVDFGNPNVASDEDVEAFPPDAGANEQQN